MLPLHKKYREYPLAASGKAEELDDVLLKVREHWPDAYMEGSAGLARSFFDRNTKLFVAYTWCTRSVRHPPWNYLIFKEAQDW